MGVPSLDFSNLKNVKEYKDWFGYSQKLENAIRLLREKVDSLENHNNVLQLRDQKTNDVVAKMKSQIKSLQM